MLSAQEPSRPFVFEGVSRCVIKTVSYIALDDPGSAVPVVVDFL